MFYSAQILSKKGPLGTCWLASWSQRGLKRNEVFNCSLPAAVDSIINPEAPLALRLSGQLLLGLVRLYLRKLQFLEEDAGLALRGLARNAAAAGGAHQADLPDGGVAPEMAITLQDGGYDPMTQFVGNDLFPSFESSLFGDGGGLASAGGGGTSAFGGAASVTVAADVSELFGSGQWGLPEEERFEVDGDALERRFSTELERLRSQGVEAPRDRADMFFGGGQDETFSPVVMMDDEVMAVPPEDLFPPEPTPAKAATPGKTPLSAGGHAPLPGLSDMRITPPSLPGGGAADLLPEFGGEEEAGPAASFGTAGAYSAGGGLGGEEEAEGALPMDAAPAAAAAKPRRRAAPGQRRRKPQLDVGRDGQPATTLPSDEIRKLLADRKPLMTRRGLRGRRQAVAQQAAAGPFDVVAQSEAARDNALLRPNAFSALAPELLQLFSSSLVLPQPAQAAAGAAGTPGSARRRRSRGTVAGDEEEAAAAAAAAAVAEEEVGFGGGEASMFSGGAGGDDFGPLSTAGGAGFGPAEDDWIEHADTQQQQEAGVAAALFQADGTPAADEGQEGLRRGRLPLQPVGASGEQLLELGSIGPDSAGGLGSAGDASGSAGSASAAQQQATAFTRNTALVLDHLRREFAPSTGSKRRHPGSHGELAAGMAALSLDGLLLGGSQPRGRLDAARWFYEALVLRNTGFVTLQQEAPYGDILVSPTPLLTGGGELAAAVAAPAGAPPAP